MVVYGFHGVRVLDVEPLHCRGSRCARSSRSRWSFCSRCSRKISRSRWWRRRARRRTARPRRPAPSRAGRRATSAEKSSRKVWEQLSQSVDGQSGLVLRKLAAVAVNREWCRVFRPPAYIPASDHPSRVNRCARAGFTVHTLESYWSADYCEILEGHNFVMRSFWNKQEAFDIRVPR